MRCTTASLPLRCVNYTIVYHLSLTLSFCRRAQGSTNILRVLDMFYDLNYFRVYTVQVWWRSARDCFNHFHHEIGTLYSVAETIRGIWHFARFTRVLKLCTHSRKWSSELATVRGKIKRNKIQERCSRRGWYERPWRLSIFQKWTRFESLKIRILFLAKKWSKKRKKREKHQRFGFAIRIANRWKYSWFVIQIIFSTIRGEVIRMPFESQKFANDSRFELIFERFCPLLQFSYVNRAHVSISRQFFHENSLIPIPNECVHTVCAAHNRNLAKNFIFIQRGWGRGE